MWITYLVIVLFSATPIANRHVKSIKSNESVFQKDVPLGQVGQIWYKIIILFFMFYHRFFLIRVTRSLATLQATKSDNARMLLKHLSTCLHWLSCLSGCSIS